MSKKKAFIICSLLGVLFLVSFVFSFMGISRESSTLNQFSSYRYLGFIISFFLLVFLHSHYLFGKKFRWVSVSMLFELFYSLVVFLGFIELIEIFNVAGYNANIEVFVLCFLLMDVFFLYLLFGLAAKDYYKRPKNSSLSALLLSTLKKSRSLFVNILVPLLLIFSFMIILGPELFVSFTLPVLVMILISAVFGTVFTTYFYLVCLKKLG